MRTRSGLIAAVILSLAVGPAFADEEYDKLESDFDAAWSAWMVRAEAPTTQVEGSATADVSNASENPVRAFLPKFRAYAEKKAGNADALKALTWILEKAQFAMPSFPVAGNSVPQALVDAQWAVKQLQEHHAADPGLVSVMPMMPYVAWIVGSQPVLDLLQAVSEKNSDKTAKSAAVFNMACVLFEESPFPTPWLDAPSADPAQRTANERRAIEMFRAVIRDYADTEYAKQAQSYIFEAENLQVGMKAPEIAGQDADGKDIKLSNFRGQVVVLDFWGFW